ncbi:MAG: hypothetical protein IT366_00660 [Candidatus Hydrogenedentes bacterium]|nr:hypothetical protein [Candidatus Hydrogenedentota bacterium]
MRLIVPAVCILILSCALPAFAAETENELSGEAPPGAESPPEQREPGSDPTNWVAAIEAEREAAYQEITSGNLAEGARALVQSLHNLPATQPDLIDDAYGSVQLLLYTMEYLMDESLRNQFVTGSLSPADDPLDQFIVSAYNVYIGQDTPEKTVATRELLASAATRNPFARIGSLFILSDPYFFDNADFTRQSQEILASEFPNLAITLEAHRYNVYGARKSDAETLAKAAARFTAKIGAAKRFASDAVIAATIACTGTRDDGSPADSVATYADALDSSSDWKARFGILLMLEPYGKGEDRGRVVQICNSLASTKPSDPYVTPDVVRARLMLLKIARDDWDETPGNVQTGPQGIQWVDTLLETRWKKNPYERCLYEDVMKGLMYSAKHLHKIGRPEIALRVLDKVGKQYPNSLVSAECRTESLRIEAEQVVVEQGPKQ